MGVEGQSEAMAPRQSWANQCRPQEGRFQLTVWKNQQEGTKTEGPSADEWINQMLSARTREYYSFLETKETLTHGTVWMNLKDMILSEISQSQKDKYCRVSIIQDTWSHQSHWDRKSRGDQGLGTWGTGVSVNEYRVSIWEGAQGLEWVVERLSNNVSALNATEQDIKMVKMVTPMLHVFYHNKNNKMYHTQGSGMASWPPWAVDEQSQTAGKAHRPS